MNKQNNQKIRKFAIKAFEENGFVKFYISHQDFKGRVRKHVGKGSLSEYEKYLNDIRKDIEQYFNGKAVTFETAQDYVNDYVVKMKHAGSIFNFKDEFVDMKRKTLNRKTNRYLSSSSINSYAKAIDNFKKFLATNRCSELPEYVNSHTLNDYFHSLKPLSHNYSVKLHCRLKEFLSYLSVNKGLAIDKTYVDSCFTEQYDNQETEEEDRSLSIDEMYKLINLRNLFKNEGVNLPAYKKTKTIPEKLQIVQKAMKEANIKKTLDCFLFMCSVGMYVSDINKIGFTLKSKNNFSYISYRRAKNNSYCKGIPLVDNDCFIGKTLIREYCVKSNSNFPLNLSLNQFDKNLKIISQLVGFDFMLTSKMARKTFASVYFFDYRINISDIQMMLGHKEIRHTMHYLRIDDDDFALRIHEQLRRAG